MKIRNIPHLVGQGFVSFGRNGVMTTAAILVLICCMLMLGGIYAIIDNINTFIDNEIDEMKTINAYVDASVSQERVDEIIVELKELADKKNSNIVSYTHITKDEVLQQMAEKSDVMAEVLEKYDSTNNPMPETFYIKFESFDEVQKLLRELETIFGDNIKSQVETYKSLQDIRSTVAMAGLIIICALLVGAVLVIMTTVRLTVFARRKEIAIMRYIGATSAFVVSPFIVEGVVIGVVSTIVASGLFFPIYMFVNSYVLDSMKLNLVPTLDYLPVIPLAFLAIGLFAGIVASAISVKKYLKA